MLNSSVEPHFLTEVIKVFSGKLDIKRHSPCIVCVLRIQSSITWKLISPGCKYKDLKLLHKLAITNKLYVDPNRLLHSRL